MPEQTNISSNNKRIAKNTIALYIRMLVSMLVSLYTSRITLEVLGVEDYGIYNVVGGIVVLFTFMNGTMATATQRFLSFDIGKGDINTLHKTFSITFWIHLFLAATIIAVAEAGGLWLIYNKLTIPETRISAAFWVFQFSILATALNIIQVPYSASIVAHEKMGIYAYFSILDVILKLALIFMLMYIHADKLILYAFLLSCMTLIMLIINRVYCTKNFKECHISIYWDGKKFKEIFNFAGWNLSAQIADIGRTQGVNIILNIFYGPALNAARGIAVVVNGTIVQFVSSFMTAMNPQIVKYYAQGDKESMYLLIRRGCKFSSFLLLLLTVPVLLQTNFILDLWLKTPPLHSVILCRLILISALINTLSSTIFFGTMASGKIKEYQIIMSAVIIAIPAFVYLGFALGLPVYWCIIPDIIMNGISLIMRPYLTKRVTGFPIAAFFRQAVFPVLFVTFIALPLPCFMNYAMGDGWMKFLSVTGVAEISLLSAIVLVGLNKSERGLIIHTISKKLLKK